MQIHTFKIQKQLNHIETTLFPTLIQINNKNYLIDAGYEETYPDFVMALAQLGVSVGDISAILVSHDDIDHIGGLHLFKKENPSLQIYCSAIEAPSITGTVVSERFNQAQQSLPHLPEAQKEWGIQFIERLKSIQRLPVDGTLQNGELIEDAIEVVPTPGHTKGHISFFIPESSTLIANDALVVENNQFDIANPMFTLDMPKAIQSVAAIQKLKPKKVICYHGGVVSENVVEKLNLLLQKYTTNQ